MTYPTCLTCLTCIKVMAASVLAVRSIPAHPRHGLMHGRALEAAIEEVFSDVATQGSHVLLASHSVARRAAPYARVAGEFFYAAPAGIALLKRHLQVAPTDTGENVTLFRPSDEGLWQETLGLGSKLQGTGPIQTYLDLLSTAKRPTTGAPRRSSPC